MSDLAQGSSFPGVARAAPPHVLMVGGDDHDLRIPFMLRLREHGFRLTAAASCDPAPFARAGLDFRGFSFKRFLNPLADLAAVRTFAALIGDTQPDIVQSFDTKPNLLVPLAARRTSSVLVARTINGMGWLYSSGAPMALALRSFYRVLHRLAARSTAVTVFQNLEDRRYFERNGMIPDGSSRLIAGSGVDIDGFDRALATSASPAQLRETLALGTSEIVVTVSRLTREKGIGTLLEAAAIVHKERPSVRFLLVGPRESEGRLAISQTEIDRHAPYVLPLGRRSDVPALLGLADVFAFPTEYREGVPRALLEAALGGVPIVTTDMPGCCDVISDGWNGFLVPPREPSALAGRILDLLLDRRTARTMGQRAAALVKQEFPLGLIAARYAVMYTELLERRCRPSRMGRELAAIAPAGVAAARMN